MLATYVTAILAVREAAGDPEAFNKWERAARLQASVAVRLRLTPSSRPPKLVPDDGPFPWDTEED